MEIRLKRVYDAPAKSDGVRILVDRIWPRGVKKEAALLDHWERDVAPSRDLRTAWHADPDGRSPEHFRAFAEAYRKELGAGAAREALSRIADLAAAGRVTLLFGAADTEVNHAEVLKDTLLETLQ